MPEGDTIHSIANALRPALEGRPVEEVYLRDRGGVVDGLTGVAVERVRALGKHLLVGFASGWTLRVHLGMTGTWHDYAPGERWQRPRDTAVVRLSVAERDYICFEAPTVQLLRTRDLPMQPQLARLGPDLLGEAVDLATVVERARRPKHAGQTIAELLLDQTVAAGIGNVFKSELLFLAGVNPRAAAVDVDDATIEGLYRDARRWLQQSVAIGRRITTRVLTRPVRGRPRFELLWVYGRRGRPCARCQRTIEAFWEGEGVRATYWCPACQAEPAPT